MILHIPEISSFLWTYDTTLFQRVAQKDIKTRLGFVEQ